MNKNHCVLILLILFFAACSKYNTNFNELPSWNSDWVMPLAKGKVAFENLKVLSESRINFDVPSLDIGYAAGVNVNVPALNIPAVGPYKQPLSDWISLVHFDTLQIKLTFTNSFPIPIGAGTKFSFRRTPSVTDPGNIIYQHTIGTDIPAGGSYDFDIRIKDNALSDSVFIYLEQFYSPGGNNVVFSSNPSNIAIEIKILNIIKVDLHANKSVVEQDTLAIDFGDEDSGQDTASYGKVNLFVENALPINFGIQFYFLDPVTSAITDSLLSTPFQSTGCNTNASGDPTNTNTNQTSFSLNINRIKKIQECKQGIVSFKINTLGYPPPYVYLSLKTYLKLQITGDLHLSFNLSSF